MDSIRPVFSLGQVLLKLWASPDAVADDLSSAPVHADEQVLAQKVVKFWNQANRADRPDGLLVVTTHRLAFLTRLKNIRTTTEFLSFPYPDVRQLEATRVMRISPAIRFIVGEDPYVFTLFSGADQIVATARQAGAATAAG